MSTIEHYNILINELTSPNVNAQRMLDIRNETLQDIFNFRDAKVFDSLVRWDYYVQSRIYHNKTNLEIPGNVQEVTSILILIQQLLIENK